MFFFAILIGLLSELCGLAAYAVIILLDLLLNIIHNLIVEKEDKL